ncbi:MAG: MerR family DNA-binding protein [Acidimicrobiia bacterium]|nr:MerR family DNA-binding protein [Acidimicrobiia bacterium]
MVDPARQRPADELTIGEAAERIRAERRAHPHRDRRGLSELPAGRAPTKSEWADFGTRWQPRLDAQIETLQALRDNLSSCIGCGCLSLDNCALFNPDDEAADDGPGARRFRRG